MWEIDSLVQRCQQGELAAFTELFRRYERDVYRLAITILRDERDAEDVVQDVFLRIFERIKVYKGESSFRTWLTAIVVNNCRDKLRRQKVRRALALDWLHGRASAYDVAEDMWQRQQQKQLWEFVNSLDDKYRLPLILHYIERLPCEDVAAVLDINVSTVYSRLNAARLKLRSLYQLEGLAEIRPLLSVNHP